MEPIASLLNTILGFLLQFFALIVNFFISALQLVLSFAQSLVNIVRF